MTELSPALVRRLPQYFRALIKFYGSGKERISSEELAGELGLVPSQVRTDIRALGCTGQRSYGYGIPTLYKKIADILQLSDKFSAVIVGSCDIVRAISRTEVFTKRGIKLSAVFTDGVQVNDCFNAPFCTVYEPQLFARYCKENPPDIIILGGNTENAARVVSYVEGESKHRISSPEIWNFTSEDFSSDIITVKNIHLSDYVMLLCYEVGKGKS